MERSSALRKEVTLNIKCLCLSYCLWGPKKRGRASPALRKGKAAEGFTQGTVVFHNN